MPCSDWLALTSSSPSLPLCISLPLLPAFFALSILVHPISIQHHPPLLLSLFLPPSVSLSLLSVRLCSCQEDDGDDDDVTLWPANDHARSEWKGCVQKQSLELIDAEKTEEEEGAEREVEEGGGGLVRAEELLRWLNKGGKEEEEEEEEGGRKLSPVRGGSTCAAMDKYRPKRPTTLALFPQLPQAGTQVGRLGGSPVFKMSWEMGYSVFECVCIMGGSCVSDEAAVTSS